MEFERYFSKIKEDNIYAWAKINGSINNVVAGIDSYCLGLIANDFPSDLKFVYYNSEINVEGYVLSLAFKQDSFYELIMHYSCYLSTIYATVDPILMYNTFLYHLRTALEQNSFFTVTKNNP